MISGRIQRHFLVRKLRFDARFVTPQRVRIVAGRCGRITKRAQFCRAQGLRNRRDPAARAKPLGCAGINQNIVRHVEIHCEFRRQPFWRRRARGFCDGAKEQAFLHGIEPLFYLECTQTGGDTQPVRHAPDCLTETLIFFRIGAAIGRKKAGHAGERRPISFVITIGDQRLWIASRIRLLIISA